MALQRWKCRVAYDGTDFEGWQSQAGGNTIQDHLERRLSQLCGQPIRIYGSGRTDSGVHARGQVFHFDGGWPAGAAELLQALHTGFPEAIQVLDVAAVPETFHARYSASAKHYAYYFHEGRADPFETRYRWSLGRRRLDVAAVNTAAAHLVGTHDFSAFGANPRDAAREDNPVKNLKILEVVREGGADSPRLVLRTSGSGYLYKMVRSLAGALHDVGIGKLSPEDLRSLLVGRVRTADIRTAPARGLFLEGVDYATPAGGGCS